MEDERGLSAVRAAARLLPAGQLPVWVASNRASEAPPPLSWTCSPDRRQVISSRLRRSGGPQPFTVSAAPQLLQLSLG